MGVPQESCMGHSLCVGSDQVVFVIGEINVARSKRPQYIFNEFESIIRSAVLDNNLSKSV